MLNSIRRVDLKLAESELKNVLLNSRQEHLLSIYPKCYYADNKMMVFENVVLDKGVFLLDKVEQQDFEAAT